MDLGSIIKAYDVRGVVPDEFDTEAARRIGAAFARFVDTDEVIVGHDCRPSSPSILEADLRGVLRNEA